MESIGKGHCKIDTKVIMMKFKDIAERINGYLYENHDELIDLGVCCEYSSIGYQDIFTFLDLVIWDSDNDERLYIDEIDEYEPLEEYIIKQINTICSLVGKVYISYEKA